MPICRLKATIHSLETARLERCKESLLLDANTEMSRKCEVQSAQPHPKIAARGSCPLSGKVEVNVADCADEFNEVLERDELAARLQPFR